MDLCCTPPALVRMSQVELWEDEVLVVPLIYTKSSLGPGDSPRPLPSTSSNLFWYPHVSIKLQRCTEAGKGGMKICMLAFFFFNSCTCGIGKFPVWGGIGSIVAGLCHSHSHSTDLSHICDLHCSLCNMGSLTHWARPEIKPVPSCTLCWVLHPVSRNGNSHIGF